MADFQQRDPMSPAFWDERFARSFTPWDRGGVPLALRDFFAANAPMTTLIPGCGSAIQFSRYGLAVFHKSRSGSSWRPVGDHADCVVEADFFAWQPARPLELIYERAFLCAMPRAMWPKVAARWAELLPAGALLAGYFFFDDAPKGPPFGIAREQLDALLQQDFECIADAPVSDSIPVFEGKERWMIWRRRPHG